MRAHPGSDPAAAGTDAGRHFCAGAVEKRRAEHDTEPEIPKLQASTLGMPPDRTREGTPRRRDLARCFNATRVPRQKLD